MRMMMRKSSDGKEVEGILVNIQKNGGKISAKFHGVSAAK
jgi:hypothetical protein